MVNDTTIGTSPSIEVCTGWFSVIKILASDVHEVRWGSPQTCKMYTLYIHENVPHCLTHTLRPTLCQDTDNCDIYVSKMHRNTLYVVHQFNCMSVQISIHTNHMAATPH